MKLEQIQLVRAGALLEGFDCQRAAFLTSINKDYKVLVKDKEDPFEDSSKKC